MISEGQRKDVKGVLDTVAAACERLGADISGRDGAEAAPQIGETFLKLSELAREEGRNIDEPFRLGVIGMFKSGKSSVLNTFLNRVILKEGRTETTAVLTELCFAETPEAETARVLFADGTAKELSIEQALEYTDIRSDAFKELPDDEKRRTQESIVKIVLQLHTDILRTVTLLDTPGFGGSRVGDQKAYEALSKVDAALMIFSADRLGAEHELEVADTISQMGRELVVLLNKIDDARGAVRPLQEIETAEAFIREHFTTVVKDAAGRPLIYRYSAKETWKALEDARREGQTEAQAAGVVERLSRWGYAGVGESDAEKGVIAFIRDRYFAADSDSNVRKVRAAQTHVINALRPLLAAVEVERRKAADRAEEARGEHESRKEKQRFELEPKILQIEGKIEDIVWEQVQQFARDVEEAINAMLEKQTSLDLSTFLKVFKSEAELAKEAEKEFRENFPARREKQFTEEMERQVNRLLKREWMFVFDQVQRINAPTKAPDTSKMLREVNNAVRGFAVSMAANIAGFAAYLFIPGGILVGVVVVIISEFAGTHFASRHANKLREAQNKIKGQMKNYTANLNSELASQARTANDLLAQKARDMLAAELDEIEREAFGMAERAERWRQVHREASSLQTALGALVI
jgi:hypothetical protein